MPSSLQKWMHTSRPGSAVLRLGHRFPAVRGFALSMMDSLFLLNSELSTGRASFDPDKKTMLICMHDASISGAPVLGLNLASHFAENYNLVVLLLSGGPLVDDFAEVSVAVASPRSGTMRDASPLLLARALFTRIKRRFGLDLVIANSVECAGVVQAARANAIPSLSLVHEFAEYAHPQRLRTTLSEADRIVFSSELAARSAASAPGFDSSKIVVIPQGRSKVPTRAEDRPYSTFLQKPVCADDIICIGCGSIEMRKGTDLFISTAINALRKNARLRFIWVGDGYRPDSDIRFSFWLREQIERSGFRDRIDIIPALSGAPLLELYRAAGMMFLSSRLDPLPNVAIDALHEGLPVVCFDRASGLVEYVSTDPDLKNLVVTYLDTDAASGAICRLADDPQMRKTVSERSMELSNLLFDMNKYILALQGQLTDILKRKQN